MSETRINPEVMSNYSVAIETIEPVIIPQDVRKKHPKRYFEDKSYRELVDAIETGLADFENDRVITEEEMWDHLKKLRGK